MRYRTVWDKWNAVPKTKRAAAINTVSRILIAPISIAIELAYINSRLVDDEPQACKIQGNCPCIEVSNQTTVQRRPFMSCHPSTVACAEVREASREGQSSREAEISQNQALVGPAQRPLRIPWLYRSRFRLCWEDSLSVLLQSVFYFVMLEILATFGIQHMLRLYRDDIERLQAKITGGKAEHTFNNPLASPKLEESNFAGSVCF